MTLFALSSSTVLGAGILDPQPGLAFWFLITFILVAAVLRWKVWGPLASTIEEREKSIQSAIDQAKLEREQAEKLLTEQKVAAEAEFVSALPFLKQRHDPLCALALGLVEINPGK